jgi:hypothetical protein
LPKVVKELGNLIIFKLVQLQNAPLGKLFKELGSTTLDRLLHSPKTKLPNDSIVLGNTMDCILVLESAYFPIEVKPSPNSIEERLEYSNA